MEVLLNIVRTFYNVPMFFGLAYLFHEGTVGFTQNTVTGVILAEDGTLRPPKDPVSMVLVIIIQVLTLGIFMVNLLIETRILGIHIPKLSNGIAIFSMAMIAIFDMVIASGLDEYNTAPEKTIVKAMDICNSGVTVGLLIIACAICGN